MLNAQPRLGLCAACLSPTACVSCTHAQPATHNSLLPENLTPHPAPLVRRYVRYMGSIRLIQEYLVRKADKHGLPRVENSNVDRSVAIIHLTVMG